MICPVVMYEDALPQVTAIVDELQIRPSLVASSPAPITPHARPIIRSECNRMQTGQGVKSCAMRAIMSAY
jgi:hypothetical protein